MTSCIPLPPKDYGDGRDITPEDDEHIKWFNMGARAERAKDRLADHRFEPMSSDVGICRKCGEGETTIRTIHPSSEADQQKAPTSDKRTLAKAVVQSMPHDLGDDYSPTSEERNKAGVSVSGSKWFGTLREQQPATEEHDIDGSHSKTEADIGTSEEPKPCPKCGKDNSIVWFDHDCKPTSPKGDFTK